jgi:hypothetical protein
VLPICIFTFFLVLLMNLSSRSRITKNICFYIQNE